MNFHSNLMRPTVLMTAAVLLCPALVVAQDTPKQNWQNLDLKADSVFGISTDRAYKELSLKKGKPVVVAVIDGGIDIDHEDLRGSLWTNPKEIPGNGKDDDNNGYVDDVHGWNFLGGPNGTVDVDNLEVTRAVRAMKPKYGAIKDTAGLTPAERDSLKLYKKAALELGQKRGEARGGIVGLQRLAVDLDSVVAKMGKPEPTLQDFREFIVSNTKEMNVVATMIHAMKQDSTFAKAKARVFDSTYQKEQLDVVTNIEFDPRPSFVGDNPTDDRARFYGNADVKGRYVEKGTMDGMDHGTAIAGIIGANRTNTVGINGIADNVLIMAVRVVPSKGDPRDRDIASAIRYAVDNGARIINISFDKGYSSDRAVVDAAVKYAQSKDVLVVHSASWVAKDLDKVPSFPTRVYADGSGQAKGWIEVSASKWQDNKDLTGIANYGKTSVDVFAPAMIYTTIPQSQYAQRYDGDLSAATVSGVAALIRGRYPALTAVQVKDIIMRSVVKVDHVVKAYPKMAQFSDVCVSGGVVNAYNALKLAATYKPAK